jgi:hypothetical protein
MNIQLARVFKSKVALALLGTLLAAAVGTSIVVAATSARANVSRASATPTSAHCDSDDRGTAQPHGNQDDWAAIHVGDENPTRLQGTITSIDGSHSSFVLTQCDGATTTVVTSAHTMFDHGVRRFSDLKKGLVVDVVGTPQSHTTLMASSIRVVHTASNDDNNGPDGDGHSRSGGGTPAPSSNN